MCQEESVNRVLVCRRSGRDGDPLQDLVAQGGDSPAEEAGEDYANFGGQHNVRVLLAEMMSRYAEPFHLQ